MRPPSRRRFLARSFAGAAALSAGCARPGSKARGGDSGGPTGPDPDGSDSGGRDSGAADPDCPDLVAGGTLLAVLGFVGEPDRPLDSLVGDGLDARRVYDLRRLEDDGLLTATEDLFVRTATPAGRPDPATWTVAVEGLVATPLSVPIAAIAAAAVDQGPVHMECSGNTNYGGFGLQGAVQWAGVPVAELLAEAGAQAGALVHIEGNDDHAGDDPDEGAAWVFTQAELAEWGAFLATELNGAPLPDDHGAPVRLVVPGWYGCTCIKWVERITLVDADTPATSQMREFASRTHQVGTPELARDYLPAVVDLTAAPVKAELWSVDGTEVVRLVGILWGGPVASGPLQVRFGDGDWEEVAVCPERADPRTWALWSHVWVPPEAGRYAVRLRIDDPAIETTRLDSEWYIRTLEVP